MFVLIKSLLLGQSNLIYFRFFFSLFLLSFFSWKRGMAPDYLVFPELHTLFSSTFFQSRCPHLSYICLFCVNSLLDRSIPLKHEAILLQVFPDSLLLIISQYYWAFVNPQSVWNLCGPAVSADGVQGTSEQSRYSV